MLIKFLIDNFVNNLSTKKVALILNFNQNIDFVWNLFFILSKLFWLLNEEEHQVYMERKSPSKVFRYPWYDYVMKKRCDLPINTTHFSALLIKFIFARQNFDR